MNIVTQWLTLSATQKVVSIASVLGTALAFYFLANTALKPKEALLYSGLDPASAGEIVARLEAKDVSYSVKGEAIYADARKRDALRLELAREGLPRQTVIGYELFDTMNSFSMTSDMFDTAYWRAKEGELARTLLSIPSISKARVHIGTQKQQGFSRNPRVTSASATVTSARGLSASQAKAMQYMIALSVSGLKPEDVAIIDTLRGVVAGPGIGAGHEQAQTDELERAAQIKKDITSMLEARVGVGNARVSVALDVKRVRETIAERRYDPEGRVLKSQTSNETSQNDTGRSASVTVASNLPEGEAGGGQSSSERTETSETTSYEVSEIVTNKEILPGEVTRMTVAVLINDIPSLDGDGNLVFQPRAASELEDLTALVTSAAGLSESRGDVLTLKSFAFNQPLVSDEVAKPGFVEQFLSQYLGTLIMGAMLSIVTLILGLFVVRPILTANPQSAGGLPQLQPMALDGSNGTVTIEDQTQSTGLLPAPAEDPIETLKKKTLENEEMSANILSDWLAPGSKGQAAV